MRFAAILLLLAGVGYGIWRFDHELMLCRRHSVTCSPVEVAQR